MISYDSPATWEPKPARYCVNDGHRLSNSNHEKLCRVCQDKATALRVATIGQLRCLNGTTVPAGGGRADWRSTYSRAPKLPTPYPADLLAMSLPLPPPRLGPEDYEPTAAEVAAVPPIPIAPVVPVARRLRCPAGCGAHVHLGTCAENVARLREETRIKSARQQARRQGRAGLTKAWVN